MLAPVTKSSAPCLLKYTKIIHVDSKMEIKNQLNITMDSSKYYQQ